MAYESLLVALNDTSLNAATDGTKIIVNGLKVDGDGGGGVFEVTSSGRPPYPGLIYVFMTASNVSATKSRTWKLNPSWQEAVVLDLKTPTLTAQQTSNPPGSFIPDGQFVAPTSILLKAEFDPPVTVSELPPSSLNPKTIGDLFEVDDDWLHGHCDIDGDLKNGKVQSLINYEHNTFNDQELIWRRGKRIFSDADVKVTLTYQHSMNGRRLERRPPMPTPGAQPFDGWLSVHWFGARLSATAINFDSGPGIAWAMNACVYMRNRRSDFLEWNLSPLGITFVEGTYRYASSLRLLDGVWWKGAGGTELKAESKLHPVSGDLICFSPVKEKTKGTLLKALGDLNGRYYLQHNFEPLKKKFPTPFDPDKYFMLGMSHLVFTVEFGATSVRIDDLVIDGDFETASRNWDRAERESRSPYKVSDYFLNQAKHSGINTPTENIQGIAYGKGLQIELNNVGIKNFGSGCIHGPGPITDGTDATYKCKNLRLADSHYNHLLYWANGHYKNLTIAGHANGHIKWGPWGTICNLVGDGVYWSPKIQRGDDYVFSNTASLWINFNRALAAASKPTRVPNPALLQPKLPESLTYDGLKLGTTIDGFMIDCRANGKDGIRTCFSNWNPHFHLRNGIWISSDFVPQTSPPTSPATGYFMTSAAGGCVDDVLLENIETVFLLPSQFTFVQHPEGKSKQFHRDLAFPGMNIANGIFRRVKSCGSGSSQVNMVFASFSARRSLQEPHPSWDRFSISNPRTLVIEHFKQTNEFNFLAEVDVDLGGPPLRVTMSQCEFNNIHNAMFAKAGSVDQTNKSIWNDKTARSLLSILMYDVTFNIFEPTSPTNPGNKSPSFLFLLFYLTEMKNVRAKWNGGPELLLSDDQGVCDIHNGTVDIPTKLLWRPFEKWEDDPWFKALFDETKKTHPDLEFMPPRFFRGPMLQYLDEQGFFRLGLGSEKPYHYSYKKSNGRTDWFMPTIHVEFTEKFNASNVWWKASVQPIRQWPYSFF